MGTRLETPSFLACLRALPDTAGFPVTVYLGVPTSDSVPPALRTQIENFTVDVEDAMRRELGASGDTLPRLSLWRSHGMGAGAVVLNVRRTGAFDWTPDDTSRTAPSTQQLLVDALETTRKRAEVIPWPDQVPGDSARVWLRVEEAAVVDGKLTSGQPLTNAIPVFVARAPLLTSAMGDHVVTPHYPDANRMYGWEGVIHMQFVVDTLGHPVESTIRDVWPKQSPPLKPEQIDVYHRFVDEARESVRASTFHPADVSGCKVSEVVDEPFVFHINRNH